MKSHALWHLSSEASEIAEEELPEEMRDQLLIESVYSMISMGTERQVALGMVPPDVQEAMKVPYMDGSFSFPCKYGYSLVGKVVKGPPSLTDKFVHVMHPHQDMAWVDPLSVYPIPDDIPPYRAVLAGNLETAVNAIWDSEISIGDSILIAGFGIIGALIASLASGIAGVRVTVFEKNEFRSRKAIQSGYDIYTNGEPTGQIFDAAFNTTADAGGLQFCIDNIGYEGQVTEVSFYGARQISVLLGGSFHTARKKIIVSQVSRIPGKKLNRWDHLRRKDLVFNILKNVNYDSLIGNVIPFRDAPGMFNRLRNNSVNEISIVIKYR